jgi:uncharacterized membrane protein YfcA
MLPDLDFYLIAIPAVLLVGLSKGGMGEALSLMGVPILSMAVSPVQAAALLLPILIAMDLVSLWMWRKHGDRKTLFMLLPGAIAGIVIGWATSAYVSRDLLRLIIGLITVLFVLRYVYNIWRMRLGITIARIYRHDRALLRDPERGEAHSLFRTRATRPQQPENLGDALSARDRRDRVRRLYRSPHEAADLLPLHV